MKWMPAAILLILTAGLVLRLPGLAERPMHHDEANQAYRTGLLLEDGRYEYDHNEHHGPSLYYLTLPAAWLTGADTFAETTETTYRIIPVLFGMALVIAVLFFCSGLGRTAVLTAALLTAVSPAMAYYSRFYIQEMLLVFFTLAVILAAWRHMESGSILWSVICGAAAGLMFATKETALLSFAAMFGALFLCAVIGRPRSLPVKGLLFASAGALAVWYVLFSSFFTNPSGPMESILAFKGYFSRGVGVDTDHVHPWTFYLRMLTWYRVDGGPVWSEGLITALGLLGCLAVILKKIPDEVELRLARFLMIYTLLLTLVYSALPYKTPWCLLSFLHGWILMAGIGAAGILAWAGQGRMPRLQTGIVLVLLFVPALGTYRTAQRTVTRYAADYRNPYVYAHTVTDFFRLVGRVEDLAAVSPKGRELYIQVITDPQETWPLPFYLREYPNAGYWGSAADAPAEPRPDIIIASSGYVSDPEAYLSEYYGLRPNRLLSIHMTRPLWDRFMEKRRSGSPSQ